MTNKHTKNGNISKVLNLQNLYDYNARPEELPIYLEKLKEKLSGVKEIVLTGRSPSWLYCQLLSYLITNYSNLKVYVQTPKVRVQVWPLPNSLSLDSTSHQNTNLVGLGEDTTQSF